MTKGSETPSPTQKDLADKAMALKAEAGDPAHPAPGQTADEGMNPTPRSGIAPSGAFGAEGQRPVLERSRKVR